jgi:polyphosphate glucokinase
MLGPMDSGTPSPGLGIDFGGTGIKAALIDMTSGELLSSRVRVATPKPSTPEAVSATIQTVIARVAKDHPIPDGIPVGIGLPGVIKDGLTMTAANIDKAWIGASADAVVGAALGRRVYAMNDADAAGLAEVRLGAGRGQVGTVLMLTVGTGIGSGLFVDGDLVPNTELGHLEVNGRDAETRISALARERRRLRWKTWALEFNEYLARVESYLWPDLIILGGGVSKVMDKYEPLLKSRAPIVPAQYRNTSGIIGAALNAADRTRIDAMRGFAATVAEMEMPSPAAVEVAPPVAEPLTTLVAPATDTDRAVIAEVKPAG